MRGFLGNCECYLNVLLGMIVVVRKEEVVRLGRVRVGVFLMVEEVVWIFIV